QSFAGFVQKVDATTGLIATIVGNGVPTTGGDGGPATAAALQFPGGLALDAAGNVDVADSVNGRVRKADAATGTITPFAGPTSGFGGDGGPATAALLHNIAGMVFDRDGNLYISDSQNCRIRRVSAASGIITTIAGSTPIVFSPGGCPIGGPSAGDN